jgi:hypothetical protein
MLSIYQSLQNRFELFQQFFDFTKIISPSSSIRCADQKAVAGCGKCSKKVVPAQNQVDKCSKREHAEQRRVGRDKRGVQDGTHASSRGAFGNVQDAREPMGTPPPTLTGSGKWREE